jgi:hypothetical protein
MRAHQAPYRIRGVFRVPPNPLGPAPRGAPGLKGLSPRPQASYCRARPTRITRVATLFYRSFNYRVLGPPRLCCPPPCSLPPCSLLCIWCAAAAATARDRRAREGQGSREARPPARLPVRQTYGRTAAVNQLVYRGLPDLSRPGPRRRVISDCHFRKTATKYDRKPGIKWLSCTRGAAPRPCTRRSRRWTSLCGGSVWARGGSVCNSTFRRFLARAVEAAAAGAGPGWRSLFTTDHPGPTQSWSRGDRCSCCCWFSLMHHCEC